MSQLDYAETVCKVCEHGNNPESMLLCDGCDDGFHIYCLNISQVPATDWFCPMCMFASTGMSDKQESPKSLVEEPKELLGIGAEVVVYQRISSKGQDQPEYGRVGLDTQNRALLDFIN